MRVRGFFLILLLLLFSGSWAWAQKEPKSVEGLLISIQEAVNQRDWHRAEELCHSVIEKDSLNDAAYFLLSKITFFEKDYASAERYVNQTLTLDSTNSYYGMFAATLYLGMGEDFRIKGDYPTYFQYLKKLLGLSALKGSDKVDYVKQVLESDGAFYTKYKDKMGECLKVMAAKHSSDTAVVLQSSIFLSQIGERPAAKKILSRAVAANPASDDLKKNYLSFMYVAQDWEGIDSLTTVMLKDGAQDAYLQQLKGMAEFNLEKYDKAIASFLSMEKGAKQAKDTSALLDIYSVVGDLYHLKKDNRAAYQYYKKALRINKRYAPVLNNYAWYIATEGKERQWPKALAMSRITIEEEPDNDTYLDTYGYLQYLLKDYKGARQTFLHALAYGGSENATMLEHYADVLKALGESDLAKIYYNKALEIDRKEGDSPLIKKSVKP